MTEYTIEEAKEEFNVVYNIIKDEMVSKKNTLMWDKEAIRERFSLKALSLILSNTMENRMANSSVLFYFENPNSAQLVIELDENGHPVQVFRFRLDMQAHRVRRKISKLVGESPKIVRQPVKKKRPKDKKPLSNKWTRHWS